MYERLAFVQGDEAYDALCVLEEDGLAACLRFMVQQSGDSQGELHEQLAGGASDNTYRDEGWILTYNLRIGYVGLERQVS
jgi:hypothetical protein